ncbi:MAG: hypothetical protein K6V36_11010 [Anaerolineae bacterium]|jgi:hypothetical protein|nr:hypothetical protein [Anaerolineae bacterium]
MTWFRSSALITGVVAAVIVLVVVWILNLIAPSGDFGWALGVSVISAFFAAYFGHIAGYRERR